MAIYKCSKCDYQTHRRQNINKHLLKKSPCRKELIICNEVLLDQDQAEEKQEQEEEQEKQQKREQKREQEALSIIQLNLNKAYQNNKLNSTITFH